MPFIPVYDIRTWRCVTATREELRFRPGLVTLLRRLFLAGLCALGIFMVEFTFRGAANTAPQTSLPAHGERRQEVSEDLARAFEAIRNSISEEEYQRLLAEADAGHTQRLAEMTAARERSAHVERAFGLIRQPLLGVLATVGIMAVLSCLWNRLSVARNARGELEIFSFFLWPRTGYVSLAALHGIQIFAVERLGKKRPMSPPDHHWEWIVKLVSTDGSPAPQFHILRERRPPGMRGMGPAPVRELAQALHLMTDLPVSPPELINAQRAGGRGVVYDRSLNDLKVTPVRQETWNFSRNEEIPSEIRAQISGMTGNRTEVLPGGVTRSMRQEIVVTDEQGRSISYNSIDELPDDVRRRLGLH